MGASTLVLLFTLTGAGAAAFSFSSSSLGAGLSILLPDADIFILASSKVVLDALRDMPSVAGDLADEGRASVEAGLIVVGVGVPREERLCFRGGGPIEPTTDLAAVGPFTRLLLVRGLAAVDGVSIPRILSLFVSESAEGGLTIPGVTDESRRCAIFDGLTGVLPPVPLTPSFLLS